MTKKQFKDAFAWTIIFGGSSAPIVGLLALAVAADIITQSRARAYQMILAKSSMSLKRKVWAKYKETGSLRAALKLFFVNENSIANGDYSLDDFRKFDSLDASDEEM